MPTIEGPTWKQISKKSFGKYPTAEEKSQKTRCSPHIWQQWAWTNLWGHSSTECLKIFVILEPNKTKGQKLKRHPSCVQIWQIWSLQRTNRKTLKRVFGNVWQKNFCSSFRHEHKTMNISFGKFNDKQDLCQAQLGYFSSLGSPFPSQRRTCNSMTPKLKSIETFYRFQNHPHHGSCASFALAMFILWENSKRE